MKKETIEIMFIFEDIDYALIKRKDATYQPYVACWNFKEDEEEYWWGQGHYFDRLEDAEEYIEAVYRERYEDVPMLEDYFNIRAYGDGEILVETLDGELVGWVEQYGTLNPYVPEDKCCKVNVYGKYYYFG